jgi:hypothetical protein
MQNLQEYNHQLCKIDFQLGNLRKLKPCPEVNHHINTLTKERQLLESNISDINHTNKQCGIDSLMNYIDERRTDVNVLLNRQEPFQQNASGGSSGDSAAIANIQSKLDMMRSHVSNNKLLNVSKDISRIVGQELGKTINLMSGKPNYNNTYFEDIDISKEEDKDALINIDKVLRDLHYYDIKKYKELSNEFPPK